MANETQNSLTKSVANMVSAFTRLEREITERINVVYNAMVTQCETLANSVGERIDEIDDRINEIDLSVDDRINEIDYSVGDRINEIDLSVDDCINEIDYSVGEINKRIDAINATIVQQQSQIKDLEDLNIETRTKFKI